MSFTPKVRTKLLAIDGLSAVQKSKNSAYHSGGGSSGGNSASSTSSHDRPELRLTPTTLRRVVQQRDKLEEENGELKGEVARLTEELLVHALCGKKISELEAKCAECSSQADSATAGAAAQEALNEQMASLTKRCEGLERALDISEKMNQRLRGIYFYVRFCDPISSISVLLF